MKNPSEEANPGWDAHGNTAGSSFGEKSRQELERALSKAEKSIVKLRRSESKSKKDQQTLEKITCALKERVKELNCLYTISSIVEKHGHDLDMVLHRIVEIIPPGLAIPRYHLLQDLH